MVAERKRLKEKAKRDELNKYKSSTFQVVSIQSNTSQPFLQNIFPFFNSLKFCESSLSVS